MSGRFSHLNALGNAISVPIPRDDDGFVGRECPIEECLGHFKVKFGTGLTGPGLECHCPYCGHSGDPNTFFTTEQIEYAKSVAIRQITGAVRQDLKQFEFNYPARGQFGIGISMKLQEGPLPAIRHYREQQLETDVVCSNCTLHYSVFGLFAYCPDCGIHNSLQVLERNLALVEKQLALALSVENGELARHLVEDALENCVSAFDGFARETCRVRAAKSSDPSRASSMTFQNLVNADSSLRKLFSIDFAGAVEVLEWEQAKRGFSKRHVIAHRAGVIDEKYVNEANDPQAVVGHRVTVTPDEVTAVAHAVMALGKALLIVLPSA